jgi:SecD/SecF fusion protein
MKSKRIWVFITTVVALLATVITFAPSIQENLTLGLDLQGGFEIVYEVKPIQEGSALPELSVVTTSILKRIDVLGVNEPSISIEGDNRVRVQLAGVSNQDEARRIISTTANLSFRDINDQLLADASLLIEGGASLSYDRGFVVVSLRVADQDAFFAMTQKVSGYAPGTNLIVTWLDFEEGVDSYRAEQEREALGLNPKFISAARVNEGIRGDAIIQGAFTEAEARELANLINSGSLPVRLDEIYSNVVSAAYGINAFNLTTFAGILGIFAVAIFMVFAYRLPGFVSAVMLLLYVFSTLSIYNAMGGVFTLPGIAALVLGVGMTVDANIITFERIKDELLMGRSLKVAHKEGHRLAWRTIFDAQFTTFISAFLMYLYGTGAIKGFATMLMVTIFATLVINVFFTKFLLSLLVNSGYFNDKKHWFNVRLGDVPDVSKGEEQRYFGVFEKVDFMKLARPFVRASLIIFGLGILFSSFNVVQNRDFLNLGIDFTSGTKLTVSSDVNLSEAQLVEEFRALGLSDFSIQLSGNRVAYVSTKETISRQQIDAINDAMVERYGQEINDSVVTPIVGRELVRNAVTLSLIAWILIMIFMSIRFEWDYAIATIVALLHDIAIVFAVFSVFRLEINIELIAVVLAIIGYSVDDSIVIFDRIRENVNGWTKPHFNKEDYRFIINQSLRATVQRSLFNTVTTVLPIFFLISLGSDAILNFNIAMLVGLVAGAYSSIFIATQVWYWLRTQTFIKPRVKKVKKRRELEEMVIPGIND